MGIKKCLSQAAQEVKPEASSLDNPWSSLRSGVTRGWKTKRKSTLEGSPKDSRDDRGRPLQGRQTGGGHTTPRSSCGMTEGYGKVKPPASTPAGKPRVPSGESAHPPSRGSRRQPYPSYSPLSLMPLHASKAIDNSDGSPFTPDNIPPQT